VELFIIILFQIYAHIS